MTRPKKQRPLTDLEIETIRMVARGWTNEQIAQHQQLSVSTVRSRISDLCHVIGIASRTSHHDGASGVSRARMTAWAYDNGYVGRLPSPTCGQKLVEAAFEVCRGLALRRPYPLLREQAVRIVREKDADLMADVPKAAA